MTPALFLTVIALHVMAALSPGPYFVVSVRVAVSEGFRPALGAALGFGLGVAIWAGVALAGLVPPDTPLPVLGALLAVILVNKTLWYAVVARLFSAARARSVHARIKTRIDRTFGGLLAALAAKIAIG